MTDYLPKIMELIGFRRRWLSWIKACLTSSCLVHRGLMQGNLMFQFLFIIAMEGLHVIIEDAVSKGLFSPLKKRSDDLPMSHLLYVHDVLFMGNGVKTTPKTWWRF